MSLLKITQCQSMLRYLGIEKFQCKYYYERGPLLDLKYNCEHMTFVFNIDGTIDYVGYRSHSSDRWITEPTKVIKDITDDSVLDLLYRKLKQKSMDKARHHAMKQYLNRQLCMGGLGFLITS
jgi:hypothetical protein